MKNKQTESSKLVFELSNPQTGQYVKIYENGKVESNFLIDLVSINHIPKLSFK